MSSIARMSARYAPMNWSHIPGFPNPMPKVEWLTDLPIFKDEKKDNVALHLVRFHIHVHNLKVQFPEDCLMNMFMATLEGKTWSWYESLPNGSLYSLANSMLHFMICMKSGIPPYCWSKTTVNIV